MSETEKLKKVETEKKSEQSIAQIEAKLEQLRKAGLKTKKAKTERDRLKSTLNKLYTDGKNKVMQYERQNYGFLVLLCSTNGFHKMFGHSALFYVYNIAPKLKLKANLQPDGDFSDKSEIGFVPVRDVDKLAEMLATLKIKRVKSKTETENVIFFKLPWKFTDEQIVEFEESNQLQLRKFNHVVLVDNSIPVLFLQLEDLAKATFENVRKMNGPIERESYGIDMNKVTAKMVRTYLAFAGGKINKEACLNSLEKDLDFVKFQIKLVTDLKIWQPKVCARIGDIVIQIQEIIERERRLS